MSDEHDRIGDDGAGLDPAQGLILRTIQKDVKRVLLLIEGDGSEGQPGFKIRIDRLEQAAVQVARDRAAILAWRIAIISSLVLVIGERAVSYLSRGHP